ncbi:MAG: hypothetical protein P0Y65_06570 [Candidatus Devosia phytovorans]|uniref:Uncharacterized protein n=1 Tax=Candidatus Devosia phytovorans TaxID=3121372 RepID=A0AAJ5VYQ5_9HYPH|nr:hypothetical protein [Devosia sp.]WEK05914.1 MAG: hypothetical protein P0Y65_06570 [Devosia sp.]
MSDSKQVQQIDLKQLVATLRSSTQAQTILAGVIALLALIIPFVTVTTNLGMGMNQSGTLTGFQAAGWSAWLVLLAFALAVASWFVVQLAPYRLILAGVSVVTALLAIIVGLWFNPVAGQLSEVNAAMAQLGAANAISIGPNVGILFMLLAAFTAGFSAWKSR